MKFSLAPNRESVTVGSAGGLFFDKRHVIGFLRRVELRVSCCHPVPLRKLVLGFGALEYCEAINRQTFRTRDEVGNNGGIEVNVLLCICLDETNRWVGDVRKLEAESGLVNRITEGARVPVDPLVGARLGASSGSVAAS
jgi:hypothetical protein